MCHRFRWTCVTTLALSSSEEDEDAFNTNEAVSVGQKELNNQYQVDNNESNDKCTFVDHNSESGSESDFCEIDESNYENYSTDSLKHDSDQAELYCLYDSEDECTDDDSNHSDNDNDDDINTNDRLSMAVDLDVSDSRSTIDEMSNDTISL